MGLSPSTDPEALVRVSAQVTRAQLAWLRAEARRRQVRSVPAVMRQIIQAALLVDQQPTELKAS